MPEKKQIQHVDSGSEAGETTTAQETPEKQKTGNERIIGEESPAKPEETAKKTGSPAKNEIAKPKGAEPGANRSS
jgi:hypothetical protein